MGIFEGYPPSPAAGGQPWLANPHGLVVVFIDRLMPKVRANTTSLGLH